MLVLVVLETLSAYLPCEVKELYEPSAPQPKIHEGSVVLVHSKIGRLMFEVEGEIPCGCKGVGVRV